MICELNLYIFAPPQMANAPATAKGLPAASTSKAGITDDEIERQLKALGVD